MKIVWSKPKPGTLWTVRGTVRSTDVSFVIESPSKTEAEAAGWRRGIEVVIVTEATTEEIAQAKEEGQLFRFTPPPRLTCWGRVVSNNQAACLVLCALATILIDLHAWHVPMCLWVRHHGVH
jgi:hypothetical protein